MDNGNTQFSVGRAGPGSPYVVKSHLRDDGDMKPLAELRMQVRDAPYRPSGLRDFEKYLDSPYFSIERARRLRGTGGAVISLLIHYRPPTEQELHIDGRLDLDESLGLVIRHYELKHAMAFPGGRGEALYEGTVQYEQEDGKAIPTHVDLKTQPIPETGRSTRWEYGISRYSLGPSTPPEEFTLAFYGLGDFERTLGHAEARSTYRTGAVAATTFMIGLVLLGIGRKVHNARSGAKSATQPRQASGSPPLEQAT